MPAASNYYNLLTTVQTTISGLSLALGTVTIPVSVRKLPTARQGIDTTLPLLAVVPTPEPEDVRYGSTENQVIVVYKISVVLIAAGNRDPVTNLDEYLNWRELERQVILQSEQIGKAYMVQCRPMKPVDTGELNANYDYSGLTFLFSVIENAPSFVNG